MTRGAKTPAAVGAASGGDRVVQAGAKHQDHRPILRDVTGLGIEQRTRWLDQVLEDPSQGNGAFVTAYAISAALLRDGGAARTSLASLAAFTGRGHHKGDPSTNIRDCVASLEKAGHLQVERRRGRGQFHRYTLVFKNIPKVTSPPLDVDPRISLERLPALLAAFREVILAARAAGLPID